MTNNIVEELKKTGLPFTIIKVKLTPEQRKRERQIEKDVKKYVMKIEEAYKKAAHSTLRFKESSRGTELSPVPFQFSIKKFSF